MMARCTKVRERDIDETLADLRLRELLRSPGGWALLRKIAQSGLTPREVIEPVTALPLVAQAVGKLIPWTVYHDRLVELVHRELERHVDLAHALVREPGITRWWEPLDCGRTVIRRFSSQCHTALRSICTAGSSGAIAARLI